MKEPPLADAFFYGGLHDYFINMHEVQLSSQTCENLNLACGLNYFVVIIPMLRCSWKELNELEFKVYGNTC